MFGKEFKKREKSESKKGKRFRKTRREKCLEKDLKCGKNRDLKKEINFIKLEEGKIRGNKNSKISKNSRKEKFEEG